MKVVREMNHLIMSGTAFVPRWYEIGTVVVRTRNKVVRTQVL